VTGVSASAPGKVVLSGEYAVLDGAPAVCMAVDRRANVKVTGVDGDWHRVSGPGHSSVEGRFVADGATIDWLRGADEYAVVDAVWRTLRPAGKDRLSIELDTRSFVDQESGKKIGVGSSAALTVALVAALSKSTDVLGGAIRAHKMFQHGAGSGVDVATSVSGGLIEYRMQETAISRLRWPAGLAYRLIWTGVPVSTRLKLDRLAGIGHQSSSDALAAAAENMATAWQSASSVMRQYPTYIEALRRFSVDHDLGIFDAGHDRLVTEAAAMGLVYKPCGAGGGDVGILLGAGDEQLDEFVVGQVASRCRVLEFGLATDGVLLEHP
jgi:phosphomevalonate kinase